MEIEDPPLGRILRTHRATASLTQEELAERAGISTRTVSDIERGLRKTVYRDTAERLASALGLEGEDLATFRSAARGRRRRHPTLPIDQPSSAAGRLPQQPTPLIGRERELEIILSALGSPDVRVLTLTGPGGIGKTRLAIEAAMRSSGDFADGASFVPLADVRDPELVVSNIAHAVGVRRVPESAALALREHLRRRRALLVLDTFEQVLPAAAAIGDLAAWCPGITVLVTSRAALRLRGEHEILLGPLDIEAGGSTSTDRRGPAVTLFIERARAVRQDLHVDEHTEPLVVEICRRVDGLPLAIELAAARVKHLSLPALLDQLDDRLTVLTGGPRDVPARQQAMRDTVEWSYDLLQPSERRLFRQLSTFAGGWTLEASRHVCGFEDLLATTSALVDQSLVAMVGGEGGVPRYRMLGVIREYAARRLEAEGESDAIARRHAEYFVRVAEEAEPKLGGGEQDEWFHRLDAENENLRGALRWSLDHAEAEAALRLSAALWQFWRWRGDLAEGRSWLDEALRMDAGGSPSSRNKALWGAAWLAYHQHDFSHSEELGEELLASARRGRDRSGERNGLTVLGKVATARLRFGQAVPLFEEALAIRRELGAGWLLATSVFNLGTACLLDGDRERGAALLEEALAAYRELGDAHFAARTTGYLAYPALAAGDVERAASFTETSLEMWLELGDRWGVAEALARASAVLAARGEGERAARIAGASEALQATMAINAMPEDEAMIGPYLDMARAKLGASLWDAAQEEGRSMPLADAIEEARTQAARPGLRE